MSLNLQSPNLQRALGWDRDIATDPVQQEHLRSDIALQLASAGLQPPDTPLGVEDDHTGGDTMEAFSAGILESLRERNTLLAQYRAPVDSRIESFLNRYFADEVGEDPMELPGRTLTLDRHGMARELSLPVGGNAFQNSLVSSYRCLNGVLNNPALTAARPRAPFTSSKAERQSPATSGSSPSKSSSTCSAPR